MMCTNERTRRGQQQYERSGGRGTRRRRGPLEPAAHPAPALNCPSRRRARHATAERRAEHRGARYTSAREGAGDHDTSRENGRRATRQTAPRPSRRATAQTHVTSANRGGAGAAAGLRVRTRARNRSGAAARRRGAACVRRGDHRRCRKGRDRHRRAAAEGHDLPASPSVRKPSGADFPQLAKTSGRSPIRGAWNGRTGGMNMYTAAHAEPPRLRSRWTGDPMRMEAHPPGRIGPQGP
jgi:hypothetical protein